MHPDEVFNLTFREFYYLQLRKKEVMYHQTHHVYSLYAAIMNMTSNLIYTISRVAGSKSNSKPKQVTAEKLIGTFDQFMSGEKSGQAEDTPSSIYSKMLMIFPEVKKK